MNVGFKDKKHEEGFKKFMTMAQVQTGDSDRISLFYALALFDETRNHINDLYDFKENTIKLNGLNQVWQTYGTTKVTKLAFNLFNGYCGTKNEEEGKNNNFGPLEIFSMDANYRNYMLMAVEIRFSYY